MMEASSIIRLNIKHYGELLKLDGERAEAMRPQVLKLLAEAEAELRLAEAEEAEGGQESGLCAT